VLQAAAANALEERCGDGGLDGAHIHCRTSRVSYGSEGGRRLATAANGITSVDDTLT